MELWEGPGPVVNGRRRPARWPWEPPLGPVRGAAGPSQGAVWRCLELYFGPQSFFFKRFVNQFLE